MKCNNEMGDRALGMYVNHENVAVSKELLIDLVQQIAKNSEIDGCDEMEANDFAIAGLLKLLMDTSHDLCLYRLQYDLQKLSLNYDLSKKYSVFNSF
tara:strand:- start:519 stop:809 length:291 start_codon:yes stop_codon:yes gene_type:complete